MHMPGAASPGPQPPPDPAHAHAVWTVNGKAMIHDGNKHDHSRIVPLLTLKRGTSTIFALTNDTVFDHPIHLHGHTFRILSRNGKRLPDMPLTDTILMRQQEQAEIAFVAKHGQPAANATEDAVLVDIAGAWMNRRRERLIARGAVALGADGIARPRLGFALRALQAFWSRPKWPANVEPIPSARLVLIAQAATRVRERAPTAGMQWLLFALSVALFD